LVGQQPVRVTFPVAGVRPLAAEHLDGDHARRVQITAGIRVGTGQPFRGEVAGRAVDHVHPGQPRLAYRHRDPEVGQPQVRAFQPGGFQQEVRRLDVAVHHPGGVHRTQRVEELVEEQRGPRHRKRVEVVEERGHRTATDQRHGEQHAVVLSGPSVRFDDVRVVDTQRLFPNEPQQRHGIGLPQHLRGDKVSGSVVPGPPHRAGPALPQSVDQFVPAGE
jgi:hypothetical protein